eukprot:11985463-Prorocentrum_lima.AAC.1
MAAKEIRSVKFAPPSPKVSLAADPRRLVRRTTHPRHHTAEGGTEAEGTKCECEAPLQAHCHGDGESSPGLWRSAHG